MSTKSGQFVYLDDGTVAQQVQIAGTDSQSTGALGVNVKQSDAIVPVDIQNRLASTIQTHSGVSIPPTGNSLGSYASSWIDTDGFDKVGITILNDAATTSTADIQWSNDNSTIHGIDYAIVPSASIKERVILTDTRARYMRVRINNTDSGAAHVFTAYAYLKA